MATEAEEYHPMVRIAAYAGSSLQFGLIGYHEGVPIISVTTALHKLPDGQTLKQTADELYELLFRHVQEQGDLEPDMEMTWTRFVQPGVCLN